MADGTHIEWTDATWQPITGCSVVSPGCTNCYAMRLAGTRLREHPSRAGLTAPSKAGPVWTGEVRFNREWLLQPLQWRRPRRIFVCAHGDLFHEEVPDEWLDQVFAVMALAPRHTFQVLTKRPDRARSYLMQSGCLDAIAAAVEAIGAAADERAKARAARRRIMTPDDILGIDGWATSFNLQHGHAPWPLSNVWLGVSVEDQRRANERIPYLLATPAAVRWVSAEPLLGPIYLRRIRIAPDHHTIIDALDGYAICDPVDGRERRQLDWVVAGGESGPGARPASAAWIRSLAGQCRAVGVPFLFKQWGEWIDADQWLSTLRTGGVFALDWLPDAHTPLNYEQAAQLARAVGGHPYEHQSDGTTLIHVGKRAAGRLLDGQLWDQYPEAAR